jgi:hypothetical protein
MERDRAEGSAPETMVAQDLAPAGAWDLARTLASEATLIGQGLAV